MGTDKNLATHTDIHILNIDLKNPVKNDVILKFKIWIQTRWA